MASYFPPIKNDSAGYTFYISLAPRTANGQWVANPTLATGDFKVALDDGAPANLTTLPAVDADFTTRVKVVLSQAETNADNITIIGIDAAGAEWCDVTINLQTVAANFDSLNTAIGTAQSDLDTITGSDGVTLATAQGNYAPSTHSAADVWSVATRVLTANTNLNDPTAAAIADAVWDELQSGHVTAGSFGEIATEIASILDDTDLIDDGTSGLAKIATDVAAILVDTNELQTDDIPGAIAGLNDPTAAAIADAVWDELQSGHVGVGSFGEIATEIASILADTNELQTDDIPGAIAALNDPTAGAIADAVLDEALSGHVTAGTLGKAIADIEADTNELQTDDTPAALATLQTSVDDVPTNAELATALAAADDAVLAAIAALNNLSVSDILTTQMTESYAANGVAPTLAQALFAIHQHLMSFAISGTAYSVKQLDQSTEAYAGTLDDATNPTSQLRS